MQTTSATFLARLMKPSVTMQAVRQMSTASGIQARFEKAYLERAASLKGKTGVKREPEDKATYGKSFYQDKVMNMKEGYRHPYHTAEHPISFSYYYYMKTLFEAVGPEQVSPHYESLSRSRRGLIFLFLYIGSITSLSRMGSWSHNEWIRGLVFHHEFILGFYLGVSEIRHFTFVIGPKFTNFYNVYSRYETQQLTNQWADTVEECQTQWLVPSKQQIEYVRINNEYEFVKKRALVNFLTNSRANVEGHIHDRAQNMLNAIERYENANLKSIVSSISTDSFAQISKQLADPTARAAIQDQFFQSALAGLRKGVMEYENDPLLPILQNEISKRTDSYKNLTAEEEQKLLMLNDTQKKAILQQDKAAKATYLASTPQISNAGIKNADKFKAYEASIGASH